MSGSLAGLPITHECRTCGHKLVLTAHAHAGPYCAMCCAMCDVYSAPPVWLRETESSYERTRMWSHLLDILGNYQTKHSTSENEAVHPVWELHSGWVNPPPSPESPEDLSWNADRSLMSTQWKSTQNLRGGGEQSTSSHTSLWKSSICELGRRKGAYTLQKVICYFKFLITKVIHTVGNTLLFSRQLKETPWKTQKWEGWAFRTMQRSVKKLISTWILKSSLYNLGQMEVKCCEKSSRSVWRNAKNNNWNFTFVKYLNRCIVIFLLY